MREPPEQVLVVRTGAIGDVVNALVFATALKRAWPTVRVGWVTHALARPLLDGHPAVDRVHLWPRERGAAGLVEVVREIRAIGYDVAVDLQRITKSALLARLSGAPRVLGYDRARAKEASWLWTGERIGAPAGVEPDAQHMLERYLDFARHLLRADSGSGRADPALGDPQTGDPKPEHRFPPDPEAERWSGALVEALGAPPVVIALGATKPANRWAPERFGQLAARIARECDVPVCLTGGPTERAEADAAMAAVHATAAVQAGDPAADRGQAQARDLARVHDLAGVRDLVGATSLRQLSALLGAGRLFVGCDTGPMHLAAARGLPVIALFGPADPRRTGPYRLPGGPEHRVLCAPPECAPCNRKTCNQPRHACMEDIDVELVLDAVRRALQTAQPPAHPNP